jgi:hypothetical protein
MKWKRTIVLGCLTAVVLLPCLIWAIKPMLDPPLGLSNGSGVDLIHARYPNSIIDPDTMGMAQDDLVLGWILAEIKARILIVLAGFIVMMTAVTVIARFHKKERLANHVP